MSDAQTRVLVILVAVLALEVAMSPALKQTALQATKDPAGAIGSAGAHAPALIAYGVGILMLLALADFSPTLATWIAAILLLLVLLNHGEAVAGIVNGATGAVQALSSTKGK